MVGRGRTQPLAQVSQVPHSSKLEWVTTMSPSRSTHTHLQPSTPLHITQNKSPSPCRAWLTGSYTVRPQAPCRPLHCFPSLHQSRSGLKSVLHAACGLCTPQPSAGNLCTASRMPPSWPSHQALASPSPLRLLCFLLCTYPSLIVSSPPLASKPQEDRVPGASHTAWRWVDI